MAEEKDGVPPHIASDFFLWLWYHSETGGGRVDLGEGQSADWWVEERLSFRAVGEERVSAVMTGEHPAASPEARAALLGGKVLRDVRLNLRRDDREYRVTLKGPQIDIAAAKLPSLVKTGDTSEILFERMFLYEELSYILGAMFRTFAERRCSAAWEQAILPNIQAWAMGSEESPPRDRLDTDGDTE